jgi:uncharacterized membrane protein YkvA (DUF1232 family)
MTARAMFWRIVVGLAVGIFAAWGALVLLLVLARPKGALVTEAMRLLPDTLRLLRRLAADSSLPAGVRARLWLLFVYLASPIDLIPDFIPLIGYVDDVIVVCLVLRSVVRRAGADAIRRHWPGTEDGLATLWRLAGISSPRAS